MEIKCIRAIRSNKIVIPRKGINPAFKDLLKRDFYPKQPNRVWVCNFSQFNVDYKQKYYICVIIDLFSRKVISYSVANHLKTDLLVHTLDKALEIRDPIANKLIFHSDLGTQFTESGFREKLKILHINSPFPLLAHLMITLLLSLSSLV